MGKPIFLHSFAYIDRCVFTNEFQILKRRFPSVLSPQNTVLVGLWLKLHCVFFSFFFFKLSYNLHTVKIYSFWKGILQYNSLLLSIFTKFCKYHHYLISDQFHHLQSNSASISSHPIFHSGQLLEPLIYFLSLWICLFWHFIYKWNHRICDHLCLAFFT